MAARNSGVTRLVAADLHHNLLELARELSATHAVNSGSVDLVEEVRRITGSTVASLVRYYEMNEVENALAHSKSGEVIKPILRMPERERTLASDPRAVPRQRSAIRFVVLRLAAIVWGLRLPVFSLDPSRDDGPRP